MGTKTMCLAVVLSFVILLGFGGAIQATTPETDFQARCNAAGVLQCMGWDTASDITPAVFPNSGLYPNAVGSYANATRDTSIVRSGSGALRFRHPAGVAMPNTTGEWRQNFGQRFSQNSHFYVQYAIRWTPSYSTNTTQWTCGEGCATSWKHMFMYQSGGSSCGQISIVMHNYQFNNHPIVAPTMYGACGATHMTTKLDGSTYTENTPHLLQQTSQLGVSGYKCQYGVYETETSPGNGTGCMLVKDYADKWITFYYDIQIGAWDTPTSNIKAYVAFDGGSYKQIVNTHGFIFHYNDAPSDGWDILALNPYMTSLKTPASADAYMWYDELIISTQPIAAPGGGSASGTLPIAPTNLLVQ